MVFAKSTESIKLQGNIGEQTIQLLEASDTFWNVSKRPLYADGGFPTESFGIFKDHETNPEWLGTVGKQYQAYQNGTMAETLIKASEGIGSTFRGGHLKEGKKVFFQVAIQDEKVANDTVKRFLTAINSHDGSTSIGFGSSNTVVICQNTFYMAYKEVEKVRHTESAEERVRIVAEELRKTLLNDSQLMQNYKRMADVKIDNGMTSKIIKLLFEGKEESESQLSTRKRNQIDKFANVYQSELASHGETAWGLFNAVTYFENHVRTAKKDNTQNVMLGTGYSNMNKSYSEIMAWIEDHSTKQFAVK